MNKLFQAQLLVSMIFAFGFARINAFGPLVSRTMMSFKSMWLVLNHCFNLGK